MWTNPKNHHNIIIVCVRTCVGVDGEDGDDGPPGPKGDQGAKGKSLMWAILSQHML